MGWGDSWDDVKSITNPPNIYYNVVELTIPIDSWNTKTVKAVQVGDLAVISFAEDFDWCIVHVPTLTRFDNAIPDGDYEEEQYIKWAWKVQQSTGPNFTALREYNNFNYKNIDRLFLEQLKQYCLSVPVE